MLRARRLSSALIFCSHWPSSPRTVSTAWLCCLMVECNLLPSHSTLMWSFTCNHVGVTAGTPDLAMLLLRATVPPTGGRTKNNRTQTTQKRRDTTRTFDFMELVTYNLWGSGSRVPGQGVDGHFFALNRIKHLRGLK